MLIRKYIIYQSIMKRLIYFIIILSFVAFVLSKKSFASASERIILGKIIDNETKEPLPFVSILINATTLGTASNLQGEFSLKVPEQYANNDIIFNFLGYETKRLTVSQLANEDNTVVLVAYAMELATVDVHPTSAEDYLKKCILKIPKNYPESFRGDIYFKQNLVDNTVSIQDSEGFAHTYFPKYLDTTDIQLRMLLFDNKENIDKLTFNKRKRDKKMDRAEKRATKKGEEFNKEEARKKASVFTSDIMTPDMLIDEDPIRQIPYFMDSAYFDDFTYEFIEDSRYLGKPIIVISFVSKKKTRSQNSSLKSKQQGFIYIDKFSDAVVGIDYKGKQIIPSAFKPILFLAGFSIQNPTIEKKVRYVMHNKKWYPQSIKFNLGIDIERKHIFSKNEKSNLDSEILMTIQNLDFDDKSIIDEKFRFQSNKPIKEQVFPMKEISWEQVNRIIEGSSIEQ